MAERSSPPTLAKAREHAIDVLCKHFAEDRLSMGELERRLDRATTARTRRELSDLLSDLPALPGAPVPATAEQKQPDQPRSERGAKPAAQEADDGTDAPEHRRRRRPAQVRAQDREAAANSVVVAVMGGSRKLGRWRPPRHMHAVAFWGGIVLDLRDAILPEGRFEVSAVAVMGGVEIIVPPGLPVVTNGFALMGGFDQAADTVHPDEDEAGSHLVVSGLALMGGVTVRLKASDEGTLDRHGNGRQLSREERRLALEERRLERHARRIDRQAQRLENRRRHPDDE